MNGGNEITISGSGFSEDNTVVSVLSIFVCSNPVHIFMLRSKSEATVVPYSHSQLHKLSVSQRRPLSIILLQIME